MSEPEWQLEGDFAQYIIVSRTGSSALLEPIVKSDGVPTQNSSTPGFRMFWRKKVDDGDRDSG